MRLSVGLLSWELDEMLNLLIEDLERLQFQLQMEAALREDDRDLSKRLAQLALEAEDATYRVKSLVCDSSAAPLG